MRNGDPFICRSRPTTSRATTSSRRTTRRRSSTPASPASAPRPSAAATGSPSSHNLIGNTLLAESFIERGLRRVREGPRAMRRGADRRARHDPRQPRLLPRPAGAPPRGLPPALPQPRRHPPAGIDFYEATVRLDLCFAHLETGRYRLARRHGTAAAAGGGVATQSSVKNALYLLGEVANLSDDVGPRAFYFTRLQKAFFPTPATSRLPARGRHPQAGQSARLRPRP